MYAIIEVADKQFKVSKDDTIFVPLLDAKEDASITIEDVLLISDNGSITVGEPVIKGAKVKAKVLEHVKADKVLVFKKKRRKRFKVKRGHRQPYTRIQISSLTTGSSAKSSTAKTSTKKAEDAPQAEAKAADTPKTATKKAPAKKAAPKKATAKKAPAKKAPAKKTTAKKAPAKKAEPKADDAASE